MRNNKTNRIIVITLPIAGILFILMKNYIFILTSYIPPCFLYSQLHLYCPACGNTRSVAALLQGDLMTSLRYNISPALALLFLVIAYIEYAFTSFGKPIKLLSRRLWPYLVLISLLVLYYIARNLSPVLAP